MNFMCLIIISECYKTPSLGSVQYYLIYIYVRKFGKGVTTEFTLRLNYITHNALYTFGDYLIYETRQLTAVTLQIHYHRIISFLT